jgi:hypothetical protein
VQGCALTQSRVATLLVRLRKLHGASDVELKESAADDDAASSAAGQSAGGGGGGGCPVKKFKFDLVVTFAPANTAKSSDDDKPSNTPARLGGGA